MSDPASGHVGRPSASHSVNSWSGEYIDQLYSQWKADPASVGESWNQFFQGFDLGYARLEEEGGTGHAATAGTRTAGATSTAGTASAGTASAGTAPLSKQRAVDALVQAYRNLGHLKADLDPLGTTRPGTSALTLEAHGLSQADLQQTFDPGTLPLDGPATLAQIVACLEETYCRSIGAEFDFVSCPDKRAWLQQRMEQVRNRPAFPATVQRRALSMLVQGDTFETFLATRFIGKKRFGLEGGEGLLVILDHVLATAADAGVTECVMGMAHRGRVSVLHHIAGKTAQMVLTEFDEAWHEHFAHGGGDVKYHQGFTGDHPVVNGKSVRVSLCPNASHLEFVCSVATGRTRARQERLGSAGMSRVLPLIIHGDAALPGQGVVSETLNMSQLTGYSVGGAVHVVINNQVGFTTDSSDSYAGPYCTGVAKSVEAPVLHVNGGDAEACLWAAQLASEWRSTFKEDIFIDMWCWRKNGHNETDEPNFTQPVLYQRVRAAVPVAQRYAGQLQAAGVLSAADVEAEQKAIFARLDAAQQEAKVQPVRPGNPPFRGLWSGFTSTYSNDPVETGVPLATLQKVAKHLGTLPEGFPAHKTVAKGVQSRVALDKNVEWAMGELLAYGTLLLEGRSVRITGQDVRRGTFSHRHAAVVNQETNEHWVALESLPGSKGRFDIINSPLTECACVGFEYGYSLVDPMSLVIWEAQFGDFANGAQVIFDQFLSAAEAKWFRSSGMTLFLPHGYEGQGPEHSSARLERFLLLAAEDNMQIVYPTCSAQVFHMLRRQMHRNVRKPLVVMTPKSMLRLPAAQSPVEDFVNGQFQTVLPDPARPDPAKVTRLLFCTGKVFHELNEQRTANGNAAVALVRIEQLYPFPAEEVAAQLARYKKAEAVWVQEEPRNIGAWQYIQDQFLDKFDRRLQYIGRPPQATPAVGSQKQHVKEHAVILNAAVGPAAGGGGAGAGAGTAGGGAGAGAAGGAAGAAGKPSGAAKSGTDAEDGPAGAGNRSPTRPAPRMTAK